MPTPCRQRFIHIQIAWMCVTLLLLTTLDLLSLELFFVFSLVGFLVATEFTALSDSNITPAWRLRLRWFILAGLVFFGYVVVRRILKTLEVI
jgi:hypothetical protein